MVYSEVLKTLRNGFKNGVLQDVNDRKSAIRAILSLVSDNTESIVEACAKDLHRSKAETVSSDVAATKREANTMLANMDNWLKDEYVSRSFVSMMDTPYIQRQPFGVVIIFGSWNYPFLMVLQPLIGAIAAGNVAVIKPSEYTPTSAELISRLVPKYLDPSICQVICADAKQSASLLASERFDYVFYTGGMNGGRAVYSAAAQFLTPVTLELGGKCPSYVDSNVNMMMAVRRIMWSKTYNAGQTCLATDYVLCHRDSLDEFRTSVLSVLREFFGENPKASPDFARIVNRMHFERLTKLIANSKGKVLCGGDSDEADLYIAPTVVEDVPLDDSLMSEELFGPVLPILTVDSAAQAVEFIRTRDKPLAIYVFTADKAVFDLFKHGTSSGGLSQNDCCLHILESNLPFGGVGHSGLGRYHGKFSIDTFSHQRSVLLKSTVEYINHKTIYPPYDEKKISTTEWLLSTSDRKNCAIM